MFYSSHMPTRLGQQSWYIRFLRQKGSSTGSKKKQLFGAWKVVFFTERMNPFFAFTPGKNNSPSAHVARIAVSLAWSGLLKKQLFGAWKVDFFRAPSAPLWCSKETLWPRFFTRFLGAARRCFLRAWWACCLDQGMCEKVLLQRASLDRSHQLLPKRWCCSPKNSKSSKWCWPQANELQGQAGKAGTCASLVQLFKWIRCSRTGRHGFHNTGRDVTTKAKQDLKKKQVCRGRGG